MKRIWIAMMAACMCLPACAQTEKAAAPAALTAPAAPANALPVGTAVKMKLEMPLSTATNKAGDSFSGRVTEDVMFEGKTIIPVGSSVQGKVVRTSDPRRIAGVPSMELRPETVTLPSGEKFVMNAVVVDTEEVNHTRVNDEGEIKGSGITHRDKLEMLAGTGAGAAIGGLAMRTGRATLFGAAIGGGAAVVYWLTKHHSTGLPAGSEIIMELSRPMTLTQAAD